MSAQFIESDGWEAILAALEFARSAILADTTTYAADKVSLLDGWIAKMGNREPKFPGNITMKTYLTQMRTTINADRPAWVAAEVAKLDARIASADALAKEIG